MAVSDYERDGRIVIPRDSVVYGTVTRVTKVGLGFRHERARMWLKFDEYETPDGQHVPFSAKLVSIDNAREKVLRGRPDSRGFSGAKSERSTERLLVQPASRFRLFSFSIPQLV